MVDVPIALFNSIVETRLQPDQVEAAIEAITTDARRRKVPLLWWIGPSTQPADLGTQLESHGFIIDENSPGMAVELTSLNESLPVIDGLTIKRVDNDAARWEWIRTMGQGFEVPKSASYFIDAWHDLLHRVVNDSLQVYTAHLNGKAVATSLMYLAAGVAGIYAVATVPEARRKGIGAQITLYPLLEARCRGYKTGVLEASEMGESVYRSLGFRQYCHIQSYRFQP